MGWQKTSRTTGSSAAANAALLGALELPHPLKPVAAAKSRTEAGTAVDLDMGVPCGSADDEIEEGGDVGRAADMTGVESPRDADPQRRGGRQRGRPAELQIEFPRRRRQVEGPALFGEHTRHQVVRDRHQQRRPCPLDAQRRRQPERRQPAEQRTRALYREGGADDATVEADRAVATTVDAGASRCSPRGERDTRHGAACDEGGRCRTGWRR
ncbi:hypothetical protein WR25_01017 [Diploscapter pachys]|uniref:Uncharacterized protein n=1 Tax=Diploscapter pachys TaxID=2018661 RepID=A0A2A2M3U0_9BILA|nr:hypothetical protein WR25_01017 [Diploscapter pachys]